MAALVKPGAYPASQHKVFFGPNEILLPIYSSIGKAVASQPQATVFINYASYRYAYNVLSLSWSALKRTSFPKQMTLSCF